MASTEYLREVGAWRCVAAHNWPREKTSAVGEAMLAALDNNCDRESVRTAALCAGIAASQFTAQWDAFVAAKLGRFTEPTPLAAKNRGHIGSLRHLRFGKVVADSLGLGHAVFGALLSPTGGIAGSGNSRLASWLSPHSWFVKHATVHDAYGYLLTCHNVGPGYQYVDGWSVFDSTNPLGGQLGGLWFWFRRRNS